VPRLTNLVPQSQAARLLPALILAYLLPLLLTLALLTPPWQNPDEPLHLARAVQIAHGGLLGYRAWTTTGGLSDPAIYAAYMPVRHAAMQPTQRLSREDLAASAAVRFSPDTAYVSFPNTAQYPPAFYLPDALSYWLGRAGGLSVDQTLSLARSVNALLFALAAAGALTIARRARPLLAALILLPTTLSLACSASQDSLMLAATLLAVAALDRLVADARDATRREAIAIALCLILVAMARPPYAGFLLALPLLAAGTPRRNLRLAAVSAAAVFAWCLLVALHTTVHLGHADARAQLAFLAANPGAIPKIIAATARYYLWEDWQQLIAVTGWTDTYFPPAYIWFATFVLAVAVIASAAGPARRPIWAALAVLFAIVTIFLLQYFTWTWPGQLVVTGVLGRYFTPPAMVLALALPAWHGAARLRQPAYLLVCAMAVITPAVTIHTILARYYIP
jgi:uncharacterized membrane protein